MNFFLSSKYVYTLYAIFVISTSRKLKQLYLHKWLKVKNDSYILNVIIKIGLQQMYVQETGLYFKRANNGYLF